MTQEHRSTHGVLLDRSIGLIHPTSDHVRKIEQALARSKGEPVWSHHQVAVPKTHLNMKEHGFEGTRLAIPLPGEDWGTPSYRRGALHAHEAGPLYLVHKDEATPGLDHMLQDVPEAVSKRLFGNVQPFVKEKHAMLATPFAAFTDELLKIASSDGLTALQVGGAAGLLFGGVAAGKVLHNIGPKGRERIGRELRDPRLYSNLRGAVSGETPSERREAHKDLPRGNHSVLSAARAGLSRRGVEKQSDFGDGFIYGPGDFTRVNPMKKRAASALSPMGRLSASKAVGLPKVTAPPGPSIADIAKPKGPGFGTGIAGANKGSIGGTVSHGFK